MKKRCYKCKKYKDEHLFYSDKTKSFGLASACKKCNKFRLKKYYLKNKEYLSKRSKDYNFKNRRKIQKQRREYRIKNKTLVKEQKRKFYLKNRNKILEKSKFYSTQHKKEKRNYDKIYFKKNFFKKREQARIYARKRRSEDLNFKILGNLRSRIYMALFKYKTCKSEKTLTLIGCSVKFLKKHLESQFDPKMTWDNYGINGWHIDHKIPCNNFNLTDSRQQKKCFNWKNLQPLWAEENILKSDKMSYEKV